MPTSAGPNSVVRHQDGGRGFRPAQEGLEDRRPQRRSIQNKPDVGVNIARQWLDKRQGRCHRRYPEFRRRTGGEQSRSREEPRCCSNSGAATADLTGKACTPNTVSFAYDTYMLANGTARR